MFDVYNNSEEGSDVSYPTQEDCVPIGLTSLTNVRTLQVRNIQYGQITYLGE